VEQVVCVRVPPYDGSLQVNGYRIRTVATRAWHLECGKSATGTAEEPVGVAGRVGVRSGDRPQIIDSARTSPVVGTVARAGRVERREFALGAAQEPVVRIVRVLVGSRDRSRSIDPRGVGPVVVPRLRVRTGSVKRDDGGFLSARSQSQPEHEQGEPSVRASFRTRGGKTAISDHHHWVIPFQLF
jgi:hypothetical protein